MFKRFEHDLDFDVFVKGFLQLKPRAASEYAPYYLTECSYA
jgi:hypothetical protein